MFTKSVLIGVNILIVLPLLLSVCANYVSPAQHTTAFAFLGLLFPLWMALNVLCALFWLIAHRWPFLISLTALLLCGSSVRNTFPIHFTSNDVDSVRHKLSVLSYNVAQFNHEKYPVALDVVLEHDPDIVCLQEYADCEQSNKYITTAEVNKIMSRYPHRHTTIVWTNRYGSRFGTITFSKYPIVGSANITFESKGNSAHRVDVLVDGDTVRVINCHLESFSLKQGDLGVIDEALNNPTSSESVRTAGETIRSTMPKRMRSRAKQADIIAREVKSSPYRTIVCGDFNDTPVSYTYHTVRGTMRDAHVDADWGFGNTFFHKGIGVCIDHLLYTPDMRATGYKVIDSPASDHLPICATLAW